MALRGQVERANVYLEEHGTVQEREEGLRAVMKELGWSRRVADQELSEELMAACRHCSRGPRMLNVVQRLRDVPPLPPRAPPSRQRLRRVPASAAASSGLKRGAAALTREAAGGQALPSICTVEELRGQTAALLEKLFNCAMHEDALLDALRPCNERCDAARSLADVCPRPGRRFPPRCIAQHSQWVAAEASRRATEVGSGA